MPEGNAPELSVHTTVVAGNPEEVQVSVKTRGDVESVAMVTGELSRGEPMESATCHY